MADPSVLGGLSIMVASRVIVLLRYYIQGRLADGFLQGRKGKEAAYSFGAIIKVPNFILFLKVGVLVGRYTTLVTDEGQIVRERSDGRDNKVKEEIRTKFAAWESF